MPGQLKLRQPNRAPALGLACLLAAASFLGHACATKKEVLTAQTDLASVRGNLEGLESTVEKSQAGLSEDILEIKRSLVALKARDDEFRQFFVQLQQRMNIAKIESDENLRHLTELNREYQKSADSSLRSLGDRIASLSGRLGGLETGLADLRQRLDEANALDNDQNRRLGEVSNRLSVFLEEANAESARLKRGLVDLTQSFNLLADKLNALNKEVAILRETMKAGTARSHVIAEGETLTSIATRYGIPVEEIVRLNNLPNPDSIKVGQRIILGPP